VAAVGKPTAISTRKPTLLEKARWKMIQTAKRKRMSLRAIERELGIHRATVKTYLDAEGPPSQNPGRLPSRRHLIPLQTNPGTFLLNN
jgi:predicted transcriptional regulator